MRVLSALDGTAVELNLPTIHMCKDNKNITHIRIYNRVIILPPARGATPRRAAGGQKLDVYA